MAAISVNELFEGRNGRDTYTRQRTYTRVYEVYTDDDDDDGTVAGGSSSLPRLGDSHPRDADAVVVAVVPDQDANDPRRWLVSIEYDTQPPFPEALQPDTSGGGPGGSPPSPQPIGALPDDPLSRPPVWKVGFQQKQEVLRTAYKTDEDGVQVPGSKPVVNSAGFLFDPPILVDRSTPIVTVTVNRASLRLADLEQLQDAVNLTAWKGFGPRTVRCLSAEANSALENKVAFWQYSYSFAIKRDGWEIRVLDAGLAERINLGSSVAPDWRIRAITDENGNPVSEPVPLDGSGRKLAPNQPEIYLLFNGYPQREFNTLIPF